MPTIFNSNVSSTVQIHLQSLQDEDISVHVERTASIRELKDFIFRKYHIPVATQQLFHQGRVLKDSKSLVTYKLNGKSTSEHPILLTQAFDVQVFISKKVLSLYELTHKKQSSTKKSRSSKKYKLQPRHQKALHAQQTISCGSITTTQHILKQLNLSHLSHLIKVCVGAGTEDIADMNQTVMSIPNMLNDGILSILFSTRWFLDRTVNIATFSSLMSQTLRKSINSAKLLKQCKSFDGLSTHNDATESYVKTHCDQIDAMLREEQHETAKAAKWCADLRPKTGTLDESSLKLLEQLQSKIQNISKTLSKISRRWAKKKAQLSLYVQQTLHCIEDEWCSEFSSWSSVEVVAWLRYMDHRIVIDKSMLAKFQRAGINGNNLADVNQLSLSLMGMHDCEMKTLVVNYILTLLRRYNDNASYLLRQSVHSEPQSVDVAPADNMCCVCVSNEANTVITPCGHAVYCNRCSKQSAKHHDRCPICRRRVESIVTVYKAGFNNEDL